MIEFRFSEVIGDVDIDFYSFDAGDEAEISGAPSDTDFDGYYHSTLGRIYYRNSPNESAMRAVRNHERLHALLNISGAGYFLERLASGERRHEDPDELEEQFVSILAPHLKLETP